MWRVVLLVVAVSGHRWPEEEVASAERVRSTLQFDWLWGELPDPRPSDTKLDENLDYPNHGFIRIMVVDSWLEVKLVKRPPAFLWNEGAFCSIALPAAIAEVLSYPHLTHEITHMAVVVSAVPFLAGCRCYAKTFLMFEMDVINNDPVEGDHNSVCDRPRDAIQILIGHNSIMKPATPVHLGKWISQPLEGAVKTITDLDAVALPVEDDAVKKITDLDAVALPVEDDAVEKITDLEAMVLPVG